MRSPPDDPPRGAGADDVVRAVIADDEPFARQELGHLIEQIDDVQVIGEAANGLEAVELIGELRPDLAFLDVQMPGLDGFQVVQSMRALGVATHVVFVTAYDAYALRAFEVSATDYLLKPVEPARLERAIDKVRGELGRVDLAAPRLDALLGALGQRDSFQRRIPVRREERVGLIDVDDLVYAYVADGSVYAVTAERQEVTGYRTLEELESDLDPEQFVRVHRSYLANLNKVEEIIPWFSGTYHLKMAGAGETEIPVSRGQAKRLRKLLKW